MLIKISLISLVAISLMLTNCLTSNPAGIPTPIPVPTPTPSPTPVWVHEITHYDGALLPLSLIHI